MDLLVVVPPGARVRWMENRNVARPFVIDLDTIPRLDLAPFTIPAALGTPIYDAEPGGFIDYCGRHQPSRVTSV